MSRTCGVEGQISAPFLFDIRRETHSYQTLSNPEKKRCERHNNETEILTEIYFHTSSSGFDIHTVVYIDR